MVWRLAWRSLWRNKRRTAITMSSIAFGLAVAIFFVSLGEGVYSQMISLAVRLQAGHLTIERQGYQTAPAVGLYLARGAALRDKLAALSGVESAKLLIEGQGMAKTAGNSAGVMVMGVEPGLEAKASPISGRMTAGSYLKPGDGRLVVLGASLARRLQLKPGRKLVITANTAQGELQDVLFRVAGVFQTGSDSLDSALLQMPLPAARELFGLPHGAVTRVGLVLRDHSQLKALAKKVRPLLPPGTRALSWRQVLPELASYINLDRTSNYVFQALLIALVLFTIFNTLLMSQLEREREFAVLLSLGTPVSFLGRQLLAEAFFLGLLGVVLGLAAGGAAGAAMSRWGIDFSFFLQEGITISGLALGKRLVARLTPGQMATLGSLVLGATLLLGLLPLRRLRKVRLVERLR